MLISKVVFAPLLYIEDLKSKPSQYMHVACSLLPIINRIVDYTYVGTLNPMVSQVKKHTRSAVNFYSCK